MMGQRSAETLPPPSNRGGRDTSDATETAQIYNRYKTHVIDSKGNLLEIPLRRGVGDTAFIDTLSFTFHESALNKYGKLFDGLHFAFSDEDFVLRWSILAEKIFGFGVSTQKVGKGRFYDGRWEMSANGVLYGNVYFGGQQETMLIELTGKGCQVAKDGWEVRLYKFLKQAYRAKITRCDVAKDFFKGEVTPDSALEAILNGEFNKRGKRPIFDRYGSDWDCDTNNGKTLYIGSKNSGLYARVYDKAKEQGDKTANWTRFEIQFMGKNVLIDLDILLQPGEFFGGAWPYCEKLQDAGEKTRNMAAAKRFEMSVERCTEVAANQVGRAINMMLQLNMTAEQIVERLRNKDGLVPERVNPASYSLDFAYAQWLHEEYDGGLEVVIPDEYGMVIIDHEI